MSFFNEARMVLNYRQALEASALSGKIVDKIGRELDRQIGKEDVAAFTWLHQSVSAGLPNFSKLYLERLNRLGAKEIDGYLEGEVD